jgi:hypothetical protein
MTFTNVAHTIEIVDFIDDLTILRFNNICELYIY